MNYKKHYELLIYRAKNRLLEGYSENHHIIPKCIGGTNKKENLVKLTPEEHYVAHQLLIKIYPNESKLIYAAKMMTVGNMRNNKLYGWLRKKFSIVHSYGQTERYLNMPSPRKGKKWSQEQKDKIKGRTSPRKGAVTSQETKDKISKANKGKLSWNEGKTYSKETRQKISKSRIAKRGDPNWNIRPPCSKEKAAKISKANTGKKWIHNMNERKLISPESLKEYLSDGWKCGQGPRI